MRRVTGVPTAEALQGYDSKERTGEYDKLMDRILRGASDANIPFDDLRSLLLRLGFEERIRGSHHIYRKEGLEEKINLQREGSKAKPYQVRQMRAVIIRYHLAEEE